MRLSTTIQKKKNYEMVNFKISVMKPFIMLVVRLCRLLGYVTLCYVTYVFVYRPIRLLYI